MNSQKRLSSQFINRILVKKIFFFCFIFLYHFHALGQSLTENYIAQNKDLAVKLMNQYHVPASIILGVAIHESASGSSKIAKYLNNHFGVKGPNSNTKIHSAYKDYLSIEDSYQDFINILQTKSKFKQLLNQFTDYDYRSWTHGIQRGGYASSRLWASQVLGIIKHYHLYELDNRPPNYIDPPKPVEKIEFYHVKKGDNLGEIANKYHTTIKSLMKKNHLKTSVLQIGQKLKI